MIFTWCFGTLSETERCLAMSPPECQVLFMSCDTSWQCQSWCCAPISENLMLTEDREFLLDFSIKLNVDIRFTVYCIHRGMPSIVNWCEAWECVIGDARNIKRSVRPLTYTVQD